MNTRQINYVLKVAEERSFSAAAKKLFVTQPSLSEFIKKVERELGYELFDRAATPLKLTVAGEIYVDTAREMLNLERTMENRMRDMEESQYGKLAIGISPYSGLVTSVLKSFFEVYPNYKVDIQDSVGTAERLRMLEQGELDLCIQPVFDSISPKFAMEDVMSDDLVLVLPASHPINDELPVRIVEGEPYPVIEGKHLRKLGDMPFVLVDNSKRLRKNLNVLFDMTGFYPFVKIVCHKSEGCVDIATSGICATIVQLGLVRYRDLTPDAKCYLIRQDNERRRIAAVYMRNRYLSKAAREFINILKSISE